MVFVLGKVQAQSDTVQTQEDSFFVQLKAKYDSLNVDSVAVFEVQQVVAMCRNYSKELSEATIEQDTVATAPVKEEEPFNLLQDLNHQIALGGAALLLILMLIFLFAFIRMRGRYHELDDEVYEIEEIVNKIDKRKGTLLKKLEQILKRYNEINTKFESLEDDKLNVEENLSFVKVENKKLAEKNENLEELIQEKELQETESIAKILDLEKKIESSEAREKELKAEIENLKQQLKIQEVQTGYSDDIKNELSNLDLNVAKLDKLNSLRKANAITESEYEKLKKKIISEI